MGFGFLSGMHYWLRVHDLCDYSGVSDHDVGGIGKSEMPSAVMYKKAYNKCFLYVVVGIEIKSLFFGT